MEGNGVLICEMPSLQRLTVWSASDDYTNDFSSSLKSNRYDI